VKEHYDKTAIKDIISEIAEDLVSLIPVKKRIREIGALLLVQGLRESMGINSGSLGLHMSFTGNPGTGKTEVAGRMADILFKFGYINKGHLITVTRDDLVGQYIGHTAPKTKEVLKRAMGGVLFIDDAYYLYKPDNEKDYGSESIEILLQVMENQRDNLVVIFAGYKDKMDKFYASNPGLYSRVGHHIHFPDYTVDDLMDISYIVLSAQQYQMSTSAASLLSSYFAARLQFPFFSNARVVDYAIERARRRHARRVVSPGAARQGLLVRQRPKIRRRDSAWFARYLKANGPTYTEYSHGTCSPLSSKDKTVIATRSASERQRLVSEDPIGEDYTRAICSKRSLVFLKFYDFCFNS
jgi:probable Rubsico expression protein CbbX